MVGMVVVVEQQVEVDIQLVVGKAEVEQRKLVVQDTLRVG